MIHALVVDVALDFDRELSAVLSRHRPFERFHQCRCHASIVSKLFAAVVNADPSTLQHHLVVGAFVCVLKSSPSAHVINEQIRKVRVATLYIGEKRS